jgi:hypothetical protein
VLDATVSGFVGGFFKATTFTTSMSSTSPQKARRQLEQATLLLQKINKTTVITVTFMQLFQDLLVVYSKQRHIKTVHSHHKAAILDLNREYRRVPVQTTLSCPT